jgi:hypothetical protein
LLIPFSSAGCPSYGLCFSWCRTMAKAKAHGYFTDGKRLLRLEAKISGGRGVVMEDARFNEAEEPAPGQVLTMSVKEFMSLRKVA